MNLQRFFLRVITAVYLLLFTGAFLSSGYLLLGVIAIKPILLIGLLKYLLLCILFVILGINALKALSLQNKAVWKLAESTKNFKWLFNGAKTQVVQVTWLQVLILFTLGLFCFWSDHLLQQQEPPTEEEEEI